MGACNLEQERKTMKRICLVSLPIIALMAVSNAPAYEQGDYVFRAGLTMVAPDDSSSNVFVAGALRLPE